jgi:hypothetical protein
MFPTRRAETFADDVEKGSNVFVPSIMGAGVLLSIGVLIADFVKKLKGDRGRLREVELVASYIAEDVLRSVHREKDIPVHSGLRSRRAYVLLAGGFLGLTVYGLIGSFWNYINPVDEGWVEDIAWIWAISLVVLSSLAAIGGSLAVIAWRYPDVPAWARRLLAHTPVGTAPVDERSGPDPR